MIYLIYESLGQSNCSTNWIPETGTVIIVYNEILLFENTNSYQLS